MRVVATAALLVPIAAFAADDKLNPNEVFNGYRAVLDVAAAGERERALDQLIAFEIKTLGKTPRPAIIEDFWRYKLRLVGELLEAGDVDLLVPIIVLHHDAYLRHLEQRAPILARHSRTMASELIDIYARRSDTSDAKWVASRMMASLGSIMQQNWAVAASNQYFRRALDYDKTNKEALLGMGAAYEKYGEYDNAVLRLENVLRIERYDYEAVLRLGMCLARIDFFGFDEKGAKQLYFLIRAPRHLMDRPEVPDWILTLAFQEFGKIRMQQDRLADAEAVLRQGVERFPGDQQLLLALSMVLERKGERAAAAEVLSSIEADVAPRLSARDIYNKWPRGVRSHLDEVIHVEAESRRPLLLASLERPEEQTSP